MQEFDFTNTNHDLSELVEHLSSEEASAIAATIEKMREEKEETKEESFKKWFDAAFLPILKEFSALTGSKLIVDQDGYGDITAKLISRCGIDITTNQKQMHMVVSAADHISVNKWSDSDDVEFSLIFGLPEDEE